MGRVGGRCRIPAVMHHSPSGSCPGGSWGSSCPPQAPHPRRMGGLRSTWGQGSPCPARVRPQSRPLGTTSPPRDTLPSACVHSVGVSHPPDQSPQCHGAGSTGQSLVVQGTVQPPVSPQCPAPAEPSKGTALRWHLSGEQRPRARRGSRMLWDGFSLAQNRSPGFFPAVLPPPPSSPFTLVPSAPLLPSLKSWLLSGRIFAGCSSRSRLSGRTDFPVFLRTGDSSSHGGIAGPASPRRGGAQPLSSQSSTRLRKAKGLKHLPGFHLHW